MRVVRAHAGHATNRMEALSDGVIAIAITLLTLDLQAPQLSATGNGSLGSRLVTLWPHYLAFATSFIVIAIVWINHHAILAYVVRADHYLLLINLLLLFVIAVIPFTTSLAAEHLGQDGERTATMVYTGWFCLIPIEVNLLWWHIRRAGLVDPNAEPAAIARMTRRFLFGLPAQVALFLVAIVSPVAALIGFVVVALFFALPNQSM